MGRAAVGPVLLVGACTSLATDRYGYLSTAHTTRYILKEPHATIIRLRNYFGPIKKIAWRVKEKIGKIAKYSFFTIELFVVRLPQCYNTKYLSPNKERIINRL